MASRRTNLSTYLAPSANTKFLPHGLGDGISDSYMALPVLPLLWLHTVVQEGSASTRPRSLEQTAVGRLCPSRQGHHHITAALQ